MPVADIYKVVSRCHLGNQDGINVHYFYQDTNSIASNVSTALAVAWFNQAGAHLAAVITNLAKLVDVTVQKVWPLPELASVTYTVNVAGGVVGQPLPTQVSGLITMKTAFAGRKFRGRRYPPFPGQADNDPLTDLPTTGTGSYMARLTTLAQDFVTALVVTDPGGSGSVLLVPCLWTKKVPTAAPFFTSALPRTVWATQRKRGSLGRPNM